MKKILGNNTFTELLGRNLNNIVTIGNSRFPAEFYAHVKFEFWGEDWLSVREKGVKDLPTFESNEVQLKVGSKTTRWRREGELNEKLKWIVVFDGKPSKNSYKFALSNWQNYNFFYQPALDKLYEGKLPVGWTATPTEVCDETGMVIEGRDSEAIVGSYAVYHKTKRNHFLGGKNYRAGKVLHIERPKATDAEDNSVWCILKIENGQYEVTIPQEFLDSAVYPVIVNDTFGYSTIGTTFHNHGSTAMYADAQTYSPASNGTLDSISIHSRAISDTVNIKCGLYDSADDSFEGGTNELNIDATYSWNVCTASGTVNLLTSINYNFAHKQEANHYVHCDTGGTDHLYDYETYGDAWPDPGNWTTETGIDNIYSNYATFTPSGVDETVYPATFALALTLETPTVTGGALVTPTTLALALTQETPSLSLDWTIAPDTLTLALTFEVSTILFPIQTILPDTFALALTLPSPSVIAGVIIAPDTFTLALTQYAPTILFPIQTILPTTLALALTSETPSLAFDYVIEPVTFELALTQETSTVVFGITIAPDTLTLALTQHQPLGIVVALPTCFLLAVDLPPPSIFQDITIIPDTFALALTQHAPTVQEENDFSNDSNCVALWNMEDGELTTDSKGTNTLTNSGVNVSTSDFKQGAASGEFLRTTGDNLTISDSNQDSGFPLKSTESNKTFSFAIWFKSDDITDSQYLINEAQSGKYSFALYISGSKIVLAISSNGTTWGFIATHASTLSSGVWYHVVVTYDNSDYSYRIRIHDSTSLIGTDKIGTATDINISDAGFYLSWPSLSLALGGRMDEVVVFSDVLTVAEIDAIWSKTYSVADVLPDTFALALTQETPIVGSFQVVEPVAFQLALTQETSSLQIEVINYPATFQLALTLEAPTIALPIQIILPDTFALALTLQTPIVTAGNIITPDVFALALTQETVIPQILQTILPDSLALVLALQTPSIAAGQVLITPDALILKAALLTSTAILRYVEMPPAMLELLIDPYKGGAWLWLAKIEVPGYDIIRIARNTEDVIYAGLTFEKSNFDVGRYGLSGEGSIPQVILRVAQDSDHVLEDIVNETEGAGDGNVKLIRTHEDFLESAVTSLEAIFDILTSESDTEWITFILGIPNPLLKKIPIRIYSSKICPYAVPTLFKGPECQYVGGDTYCTGKYDDCLTKGNTNHWGSELGLDPNTARI